MTRSQLITKVANDTNMTAAEVEKVMDGIFGTIGDVLKSGDKVTIAGFGRFEMRERQTKNFTNPKTKVTSKLEPTAIPGFKASGRLKERSPADFVCIDMIWKDPRKCGSFLRLSLPCQREVARRAGGIPTGFPGNLNTPAAE